ncbi:MAG: alcohol dehydrogenase catalytic domain-containing protein [Trueperaceae bacterium]|nr:alcohol dehydrogenase catalytic domain-containing protein [Trueperaceae bacterium]
MRALVWHGPRAMSLEHIPVPTPGPDDVLVRVEAVGICGSELSGYLGHNSLRRPPLVMGHEFAGEIVGGSGLSLGTAVTVNPLVTCGVCDACRDGRDNLCRRRALVGAHRPGAFAELVAVPAAACVPLANGLDFVDGALVEPLACAVRAVRLGEVGPSSRVRVIGAGTIGLFCAVAARTLGAAQVTINDLNTHRAAVARAWGFETGPTPEPGGTVVIDAVGMQVTRRAAVDSLERGGTAVFVGLHEDDAAFSGNDLVREERTVRGCFAYTSQDFRTAADWLSDGALPERGDWLSERPLEAGPAGFDELVDAAPSVVKIVLRPGRQPEGA